LYDYVVNLIIPKQKDFKTARSFFKYLKYFKLKLVQLLIYLGHLKITEVLFPIPKEWYTKQGLLGDGVNPMTSQL
jgi:hypothetical protein